jgi:endogenous inhibitor of DNA gyrase (YacG/DUF329 family)
MKKEVVVYKGRAYIQKPEVAKPYKHGYVNRARYIMSCILGRELLSEEHVHHVNGDSLDDRPENLRLLMRTDHIRLHRDKGGGGRGKTMDKTCPICGNSFKVAPSDARRGKAKYCSLKCRDKARSTKVTIGCLRCGKTFAVAPAHVKDGRKFCSIKCKVAYQKEHHNIWTEGGRRNRSD